MIPKTMNAGTLKKNSFAPNRKYFHFHTILFVA